jgi:hypothetical protein
MTDGLPHKATLTLLHTFRGVEKTTSRPYEGHDAYDVATAMPNLIVRVLIDHYGINIARQILNHAQTKINDEANPP